MYYIYNFFFFLQVRVFFLFGGVRRLHQLLIWFSRPYSKSMKLHNPIFLHYALHTSIWFYSLLYYASILPLLLPLQQTRLAVWLCSNSKNPLLMTQLESWAYGIILFSSAIGMELHAAATIKESRPWHYRGINCVEPLHLTLETSPFLQPSTICFDCDISIFQITRWEEKFQPAWPTALNSR